MSDKVKVVIDAMGGDNAPAAIVKGAYDAAKEYGERAKLLLVGPEAVVKSELAKYEGSDSLDIEIVNATEVIDCNESPTKAIKGKKDSSIVVGMNLIKEGKADAMVSAGSTGALLVGGQLLVKRIRGINRTPLAPVLPTINGVTLLCDSGANMDAKPEWLVQYAKMGSIYMEKVVGIKKPRVALVNVGLEEEKGNQLIKETYPLLKECKDINFIGFVEAREIPYGACDVVVADAFVGNVIIKLYEGTAGALLKIIKESIMSTTKGKIGGALIKSNLKSVKKLFDTSEYGGAPFLGLNGLVVKTHGNSGSGEIKSAVRQCITFNEQNISKIIKENVADASLNAPAES
ncbi:MAG: phosphate acyltransferase PlsX [Clostridiales bacterium]|nr:phosphate acyltransferase PlsX [Clostridiales bacterium]